MDSLRQVAVTLAGIMPLVGHGPGAGRAEPNMAFGNYNLQIVGRYDFHTWLWSVSRATAHVSM